MSCGRYHRRWTAYTASIAVVVLSLSAAYAGDAKEGKTRSALPNLPRGVRSVTGKSLDDVVAYVRTLKK